MLVFIVIKINAILTPIFEIKILKTFLSYKKLAIFHPASVRVNIYICMLSKNLRKFHQTI